LIHGIVLTCVFIFLLLHSYFLLYYFCFFRQGDEERKRKIPISPFMDRQKANLPQSQVGFLDFLVIPMFTIWVKFLELDDSMCPLMLQLKNNKEHWKSQLETVPTVTTPAAANHHTVQNIPSATAGSGEEKNNATIKVVVEERKEQPKGEGNKVAPSP
jgi:hypothetical protein